LFFHAKDLFFEAEQGWPAKLRHREPVSIAGDRLAVVASPVVAQPNFPERGGGRFLLPRRKADFA